MTQDIGRTSEILEVVARHRRELLALERDAASAMVRRYGQTWTRMRGMIERIITEIAADGGPSPGEDPTMWLLEHEARLRTQQRLQDLQGQLEAEIRRLHAYAEASVQRSESEAIAAALRHTTEAVRTSSGASVVVGWNRLPSDALRDLIGATRTGTPLRTLLEALGTETAETISSELIVGMALSENPRAVARRLREAFGDDLSRALRLSRTETLRAYRTATNQQYRINDQLVVGWRWLCAKQARTCAACLALDGRWFPNETIQQDHPNGRCTSVPSLRGLDDPSRPADWQTGAQWLEQQEPAVQDRVLGKRAGDAYRAGQITLGQLQGEAYSPVWGWSPHRRKLGDVLGGAGLPPTPTPTPTPGAGPVPKPRRRAAPKAAAPGRRVDRPIFR